MFQPPVALLPVEWNIVSASYVLDVQAGGQAAQEPPQSTPVSVPFCTPSLQVGAGGVVPVVPHTVEAHVTTSHVNCALLRTSMVCACSTPRNTEAFAVPMVTVAFGATMVPRKFACMFRLVPKKPMNTLASWPPVVRNEPWKF